MHPAPDRECPREADVLEAVSMGRWPECNDEELVAHVASCGTCAEVADISFTLQDHHRALTSAAAVPTSAVVWWKAQRRARAEAARTAARPIRIVQGIGLVCGLAAVVVALAFASPVFAHWFSGLGSLPALTEAPSSIAPGDSSLLSWVWPLAIGACLLVASLLFFVIRDEA